MLELVFRSIEILAVLSGGVTILLKMGKMMGTFEVIGRQQAQEIADLKDEMKQMNVLITQVAVQKAEMASMQEQISLLTRWYDELRHGRGFVRSP